MAKDDDLIDVDPAAVAAVFDDLLARFGGKELRPSQLAIVRVLATELSKLNPDVERVLRLERLLPIATSKIEIEFVSGRPLCDPETGLVRPWDYCDEPAHREALIAIDHGSVPEQFRRKVSRDALPPPDGATATDAREPWSAPDVREASVAATKSAAKASRPPPPEFELVTVAAFMGGPTAVVDLPVDEKQRRARANHDAALVGEPVGDRVRSYPVIETAPDVAPERSGLGFRRFDNFQN